MLSRKIQRASATARAIASGYVRAATGRWQYCISCESRVRSFLPWRGGWAGAPPLMRVLGVVGSDRQNFACPHCRSTDRERHLKLYLQRTGLAEKFRGARVLHIAPEPRLADWIKSFAPATHVLGDLYPSRPEVQRIDLESIPFDAVAFDFVIANHVLEHVNDLSKATGEIARVLAPGGLAVLQVPFTKALQSTLDDPSVAEPEARLQLYGQEDHVRLFGRDVYERIATPELRAVPVAHAAVLADIDAFTYGVNVTEDLMLFERVR